MKLKIEKNQYDESWFFKKIDEIDKCPAWLTNIKREKTKITIIKNEKGNIIS